MTRKTSPRAPARPGDARAYYAPHVLQQVQSLLSGFADPDCASENDLATARASDRPARARAYYAPHVLQQVQSLLSGLADLDCAFENDLATVRASDVPEVIKQ